MSRPAASNGCAGRDSSALVGRPGLSALEPANIESLLTKQDRLRGTKGGDRILGRRGGDCINARSDAACVQGDRIKGGGGRDKLRCGAGRDRAIVDRRDQVNRSCERVRRSARR